MPIPAELLTFAASFIGRALVQHMAYAQQNAAAEREAMMKLAGLQKESQDLARETLQKNNLFGWTCSIIAILAVLAIIVLPKLAFLISPDTLITYGYNQYEESKSILWGLIDLGGGLDKALFQGVKGIFITPLDTHLVSAIAGLYMGGINVRRR
jgi:hypothetical protein